ncbi:MAG: hypothetical protein U0800_05955 [Isosphaeraceae bacterium]
MIFRKPSLFVSCVLFVFGLVGCGANSHEAEKARRLEAAKLEWSRGGAGLTRAIDEAEVLTLYSIDGISGYEYPEDVERLRSIPVLGRMDISQGDSRAQILSAIKQGYEPSRITSGNSCFDPRHAIRIEKGGETSDYVICFECHWVRIFIGDSTNFRSLTISEAPRQAFDDLLTSKGIPLPRPPGKPDPPGIDIEGIAFHEAPDVKLPFEESARVQTDRRWVRQ